MLRLHARSRRQVGDFRRHKTTQRAAALCLLSSLSLSAAVVWGQDNAAPPPAAEGGDVVKTEKPEKIEKSGAKAPAVSVPFDYKLNAGDMIQIIVLRHKELSVDATILPDGNITMPILNQINVKGLTVQQVSDRVVKGLQSELTNPQALTTVLRRAPREISVFGQGIRSTGKKQLGDDMRLMQVISDAGGLQNDRPEWIKTNIYRGESVIPVDMTKLLDGDASQNIKLEPNDVIWFTMVDLSKMTVRVQGEIKEGDVPYPRDGSIRSVLSIAGQPRKTAWLSQSVVMHPDGTKTKVDLRNLMTNGSITPDIKLVPGDTIIIPENKQRYAVMGGVQRSGEFLYPEDEKVTVLTAVSMAGNLTQDADVKKAAIVRKGPEGKSIVIPLNLEKLTNPTAKTTTTKSSKNKKTKSSDKPADDKPKVAAIDMPLEPDDQLVIPRKNGKPGFDVRDILAYVSAFGILRNITR